MSKEATGTIFNIQHYCIHDGPGIRTAVFLKGCPLSCFWCQNPESQAAQPELFYYRDKCTGCGKCIEACPEGAVQQEGRFSKTNREKCKGAGNCAAVCGSEARNLMGWRARAEEVFADVAGDAIFYEGSGGGMTLSGGEPLYQPEFAAALLRLCKEASLHTAIETSGFAPWGLFEEVLEYTDLVLYDLKHMDPREHLKGTGVSNERILENAIKVYHTASKPMWIRLPIVPGFNDSPANIEATAGFVAKELGADAKVHLLPYHRLGETKYELLEKSEQQVRPDVQVPLQPPGEEKMAELLRIVQAHGLSAQLGG